MGKRIVFTQAEAEGAARGWNDAHVLRELRRSSTSKGIVELLRSSELAGYIIKPRAAHGVIQVYRLRRLVEPENTRNTSV
jgi:hypothetical protein